MEVSLALDLILAAIDFTNVFAARSYNQEIGTVKT